MKTLHTRRVLTLLVVAIASAGIAGCERESDLPGAVSVTETGLPSSASPSAVVIGVVPSEASTDTVQTTPVSTAARTDVEQKEKTYPMPWPGQPNDHSNLAPNPSQKAESAEPRPVAGQTPTPEVKADAYRSPK